MTLHTKYRPSTLSQLVGQDFVKRALGGALTQRKIAPAYLFTGARGTGKTSTARILAKSLNCQLGVSDNPCNRCKTCLSIDSGSSLDVIEIDAASNSGVDDARELRSAVLIQPISNYRVFIIDECHMLSTAAQNALLKTLEEPPSTVVFILATTDPQRVLPTIISRCHEFKFKFAPQNDVVELLSTIAKAEKINVSPDALKVIAQVTGGGLRDAQTLLATLSTLPDEITPKDVYEALGTVSPHSVFPVLQACELGNVKVALTVVRGLIGLGAEPKALLDTLIGLYRDVLTWCCTGSDEYLNTPSDVSVALTRLKVSQELVITKLERLSRASAEFNLIPQSQISVFLEVLIMELATMKGIVQVITPNAVSTPVKSSESLPVVTHSETQDNGDFNADQVMAAMSLFTRRVFQNAILHADGRIVFPDKTSATLATAKAEAIHDAYTKCGYDIKTIKYQVVS